MRNHLLSKAREDRGWTQEELAERMRVSKAAVKSWESGRCSPSLVLRVRLCKVFEMTAAQLGLEQNSPQQSSQEEAQPVAELAEQDPNRRRMLKRVRTRWISGVLDHSLSLYQGTPIHLSLRECPDVVINPWSPLVEESNLPSHTLPPQTHITGVYDEADGNLLILGEPGAGKTTLLLELARDLLERASLDETHPIPVVFNLASWAEKRAVLPLWLVDEPHSKYQIPYKLAHNWVSENHILPLLDGLDEVAEAHRAQCIQVINAYHREHGFVPIVVCSRSSEYLALNNRIALNNAVTIEPLSWEAIASSLCKAEESLQGVEMALQNDTNLQEMASTPLMLTIIVRTFQDTPIDTILHTKDSEKRRRLIFEKYTQRVLTRRGARSQYSLEQTKHWLAWLAEYLKQHNQTEFYLERIQPDTLLHNQERFHQIIVQAICCLETLILAATLAWLRGGRTFVGEGGGLLAVLGSGPWERVLGWMSTGLGLRGLGGGGLVSLVFAIVAVLVGIMVDCAPTEVSKGWTRIRQGILTGIRTGCICAGLVGSFCLLLFGIRSGFPSGLSYGSSFGLLTGLIIGTLSGLTTSLREEKPVRRKFLQGVLPGFFGLIGFWGTDQILHVTDDFAYGFVVAIFFYAAYSFGKANQRLRIPEEIQPAEIVTWSWSNARRNALRDLTRGSVIGLITSLSIALCLGSVSGIARGPTYGIALGSVFGPIVGVSVGIAAILSGLLNSGLTSDILQKQERILPNEGIHRSVYNAVLAAIVLGPIGGVVSGIACGISFGLIGHLTTWPILASCFALAFAALFSFYFLMVRGLIAVIEHFALRVSL